MTWITPRLLSCIATLVSPVLLALPPPGEPLDPERAFPVTGRATRGGIDLAFRILDGYYLYGDRFRVEVDPGLPIGAPRSPKGEAKDDPFIGRTEVLRRSATVRLPFTGNPRPGSYRVRITAQGCAEEKLCYAPFSQVVHVTIPVSP